MILLRLSFNLSVKKKRVLIFIDKNNRRSRGLYLCRSCGLRLNADHNAAINIRKRLLSDPQVVPSDSSNTVCSILLYRGAVTPPVVTSNP